MMGRYDEQDVVKRFWLEVFNNGNVEAIDELLARDYVLHDLATKEFRTRETLKHAIGHIRDFEGGLRAVVESQMIAEGGWIVTYITIRHTRGVENDEKAQAWETRVIDLSLVFESQILEAYMAWEQIFEEWRWPPW